MVAGGNEPDIMVCQCQESDFCIRLKEPDPEAGTKEGNMVSNRLEINGENLWCGWFHDN
jgi:hypothetical protein